VREFFLEQIIMTNQFQWIAVSTAMLLSISNVSVYAQNEPQQEDGSTINLESIACRSLLKQNDTDQEATIAYFHGFMSGKNNKLTANTLALSEISDQIIDHCIDNPNDSLLQVFEEYRQL
jgi:hypothetical protein